MARIHEMQQTGTPRTDAQSHDTPQTLGTSRPNGGTQVKETGQDLGTQAQETMQAAGPQSYEQGRESLQDLHRTTADQSRQRPLQARLIADGIGGLLSILWQRA